VVISKMGPIGYPETPVINYHHSLSNDPEERSFHLLRGGSQKSHKAPIPIPTIWRITSSTPQKENRVNCLCCRRGGGRKKGRPHTIISVEIKCQLDATDGFFIAILLLAQHVSGTIMPIIRSSNIIQVAARNTTGSNHLYNTLELLMMGIMVPETC